MPASPRRRLLAAAVAATTVAALTFTGGAVASAAPQESFPGSVPSWATTANDAGVAPKYYSVEGEIFFDLRHPEAAAKLAHDVSTPGTARYGKPASPAAWIKRFSPKRSEFDHVVRLLKKSGLTITGTPESRLFIVFRGTAEQLGAAFGTSLHRYRYEGHLLVAPSRAPRLSDSLAERVLAVRLDQGALLTRPSAVTPSASSAASAPADQTPVLLDVPCSKYYGQHAVTVPEAYGKTSYPTRLCGYTGSQLRAAYGATRSMTGAGQTVAIIDAYASPTIAQDVNRFSKRHGQPGLSGYSQIAPKAFTDVDLCGGRGGWQVEQTLDVQAVHDIAPAARILYVGGSNCGGGLDIARSKILDGKLATIVTNSYGYIGEAPADVVVANENQHLQAAAEGIGFYYSSGDEGDTAALTGTAQPDYPASSALVTAVGGTTLGITRRGSVALETGWGSSAAPIVADTDSGTVGYGTDLPGEFVFGAGGGRSGLFAQPSYQAGIVPADLAGGQRVAPDISADADPYTGALIGVREIDDATGNIAKYDEFALGGTSLASPLVAAQIALIQQRTGRSFGFLNPVLYAASASGAFRDTKPVQSAFVASSVARQQSFLVTNDTDTSLETRDGYDAVTGLGSLVLPSAAEALAAAAKG